MPSGLQCWDANGVLIFDTNTSTCRVIGSRTFTSTNFEQIIVPVSPGKRLWWHFTVTGNTKAYAFLDGYVDPSLNIPNRLNLQADMYTGGGSAHFFWGEY